VSEALKQIGITCAEASLLAIGGATATLPEIQRQFVDLHHLLDFSTFVRLIAVGQVTPGPNCIVISLLGWQIAGFPGFIVATIAFLLPSSLLAFAAGRILGRYAQHAGLVILRKALAPIAVGLLFATGVILAGEAWRGSLSLVITASMVLVTSFTKINPLWGIGSGALLGWIAGF